MLQYVIRRLLQTIPTIIGLSIITFAVLRVTGDPAAMILGETATPAAIAAFRAEHGLDAPIHVQYLRYVRGALVGDFGKSLRYEESVGRLIVERLPATLELGGAAMLLSLVVGIPVGIFSAVRRSGFLDFAVRVVILFGQAIPGFYMGILLIMLFGVQLKWLPTGGRADLKHLILPAFTLGSYLLALVVRFTRSSMLDVLRQDYIRTATAKGLPRAAIILRHAFKNATIPLVTIIGLQIAVLFSGAIVTETIFSWPGLGRFIVSAIYARDFPVVQTVVLFVAILVVLVNLVVDIIYAYLDPRIHYA